MRIFVKYNGKGEILSVSKVDVMPGGLNQPYGMLGEDEFVLEVPGEGEFLKLEAIQLHENYEVDVEKAELVKRA